MSDTTSIRPCGPVLRLRGWGLASRQRWDGFPQDAPFGSGAEEIEDEPGDEFRVVGDGDVTEAVEPSELRVGDKREEAGRLHADQGVGGSLHDQHGTGDPVEAGRDVERAGQDGLLVGRGVGEVQQQLAGVPAAFTDRDAGQGLTTRKSSLLITCTPNAARLSGCSTAADPPGPCVLVPGGWARRVASQKLSLAC